MTTPAVVPELLILTPPANTPMPDPGFTYKLTDNAKIISRSDGAFIPSDDPAYLAWVAKGNTATPIPLTTIQAQITDRIQAYRYNLWVSGGYKVTVAGVDKWFHSDVFSRTQQLGLLAMGTGMPEGIQWKTMDGSFVPMTPTLAQQILAAGGASDQALMTVCETLTSSMLAAPDPTTFDITKGWPKVYGE